MSESLKDILLRRGSQQPPEIAAIKDFVMKRFNASAQVSISKNSIVITVPGSALASTLRMHIFELQNLVNSPKKLIIRIG